VNAQVEKYISRGYKKVEGWFSREALEIIAFISNLQTSEKINGALCEIGVHHGRSFVLLSLLSQSDEICLAIDLFENQDENIDESGFGNKDILLKNLKSNECDLNRVKIIQKNSLNLSPSELLDISKQKFRFFSIDGSHLANTVQNDISIAESVLCKGGIVLMDDYFNEQWPGVSEGTLKHLLHKNSSLIPFAIFENKVLFINSADEKSRYVNMLKNLAPRFIVKESKFLGETCIIIYSSESKMKNYLRQSSFWQSIKNGKYGKIIRRQF
jgi:hypothetical protein